jgi:hypothetical protein
MEIKSSKYTPKELRDLVVNLEEAAQIDSDAHLVFKELKRRIDNGINISYSESSYFYRCLKSAQNPEFGNPEEYQECYEHIFMDLFRIYAPNNLGCELNAKDKFGNLIPLHHRNMDATKLAMYFSDWKTILNKPIADIKIELIKKEIEKDLVKIQPLKEIYGANYFRALKKMIYLRSKFVYNTAIGILDSTGEEVNVGVASLTIRFNPKSLIHILYRHYGQIMKPYQITNEDYFTEEINYDNLGGIIKDFLGQIHILGHSIPTSGVIHIRFIKTIYAIVINKSIIVTFYPVSNEIRHNKLKMNYVPVTIDDKLKIFVEK